MSREYTGFDGWSSGRLPGTEAFSRGLQTATAGALIFNGSYAMRWKRNSSGVLVGSPSVHGTGRAFDMSRRAGYLGHPGCDRSTFERFIDLLVDLADDIGLELLLDYEGGRSWKCDRAAWRPWDGGGPGLDWFHAELDPDHANQTDWVPAALDRFRPATVPTGMRLHVYPGNAPFRRVRSKPAPGPRRDGVIVIQTRLNALGYDAGPIDGWFGPRTETAVKAFQTDRGLEVDGIVGPLTWPAMFTN